MVGVDYVDMVRKTIDSGETIAKVILGKPDLYDIKVLFKFSKSYSLSLATKNGPIRHLIELKKIARVVPPV